MGALRKSPEKLAAAARLLAADVRDGLTARIGRDRMINTETGSLDALGMLLLRVGMGPEQLASLERRRLSPYEVIEEVIRQKVNDYAYDASLRLQNACDDERDKERLESIADALEGLAFGLEKMAQRKQKPEAA